jgi:hypothetical protein
MNIDDRLRHAFTDLEIRVSTAVSNRPQPAGAPAPKPPNRFVRVVAVAAIVILVIGVAAILREPGESDVAEQPSTTVTTGAHETSIPAEATTTIPADGETDPGKGISSTTIAGGPATTTASPDSSVTTTPAVLSGLVTVATDQGVVRYVGDENLIISMLDRPATIAFALADTTLVYQDAADSSIHVVTPSGEDSRLAQQAEGDRVRLLNVVDYGGQTRAAYTVRQASEATTETLVLVSITDSADTWEFLQVGGVETGLSAVSAAPGMLLLEHSGEGMVWYSVFDAAGDPMSLDVAPTEPCPVLSPSTCGWHMHLLTDGSGVAVVETDGTDSSVVLRDLSGALLARAEFPDIAIADIDVAGPRIAVSTWSATEGEPTLGDVYLVMHFPGEANPFPTPLVGYATADRT